MTKSKTAVVIPIYKAEFAYEEEISLRQVCNILKMYDIIAAVPESMDTSSISSQFPMLKYRKFADSNFKGIRAYNKMMLSSEFYRSFSDFDYILIYQLDAYVFSDKLQEWADRGYGYVGAPWIPTKKKYFSPLGKLILQINRKFRKNDGTRPHNTFLFNVGNGGLSLRKTADFIRITEKFKDRINSQLADDKPFYPEDLWLFYETSPNELSRPDWKEALDFAFEQNPEESFLLNNHRLPFGCHAWYHKMYSNFWKKIIK